MPSTVYEVRSYADASSDVVRMASHIHTAAFDHVDQQGWSQQVIANLAATDGALLVAAFAGKAPEKTMVGFVLTRIAADEAELLTIAVDPAFQRSGVAALLIMAAQDELKKGDVASFFLEVRCDNAGAIACYRKLGFEKIATRRNYYTDKSGAKVDASIFKLLL